MPDVPTFTEAGYKDLDIGALYGFLAPAGTPKDVVAKFNKAVASVLADREFVERNMASQGMAPALASPDEFAAEIRKETARMKDIVKQSGARWTDHGASSPPRAVAIRRATGQSAGRPALE